MYNYSVSISINIILYILIHVILYKNDIDKNDISHIYMHEVIRHTVGVPLLLWCCSTLDSQVEFCIPVYFSVFLNLHVNFVRL